MNENKRKKNRRPYIRRKLRSFVGICFIFVVLFASILCKTPIKKVNADETLEPQISFYTLNTQLYMDLYLPNTRAIPDYLSDFVFRYGYSNNTNGQHILTTRSIDASFTYVGVENEFRLYRYVWTASSEFRSGGIYLYLDASTILSAPDDVGYWEPSAYKRVFQYNPYITNIFARANGYNEGYNEGYEIGFTNGEEFAREQAYQDGYNEGYNEGYEIGLNVGESSQIDFNFLTNIFNDIDAFFSIHLAPFLTIGEIVTAPLIIWFVWFIIKQFKGGD